MSHILALKYSFGQLLTDKKKMANLLDKKFSTFGIFNGDCNEQI